MPTFRTRPVTIEAMYFDGSYRSGKAILDWADETVYRTDLVGLKIETMEGILDVSPGDWVIKGVIGEFYPCEPDQFQKKYELVEES